MAAQSIFQIEALCNRLRRAAVQDRTPSQGGVAL
jgi:hypothetical protein